MKDHSGIYIVLLNWNGWRDTIACLESLLPDINRGARVVVCDNDSGDGSLAHIEAWAGGALDPAAAGHPRLERLRYSRLARPEAQRVSRQQAESGSLNPRSSLVLIDNGGNLGFAAGNNVGLRFALRQPDMTHVWLLNNDTLVEPDCLAAMRDRLAEHGGRAVCGSVIHFFDDPERIQCIGGNRFDSRRGIALTSEGRYLHEHDLPTVRSVEARIDYLSGCSTLVPRAFLEGVGLLNEDYFLYYEEIDWFTRCAGRFDLLVAENAHLYHREGASIGSRSWGRGPSLLSDMHMFRSRLHFMRTHHPTSLWHCALNNWIDVIKRLACGQWRNALLIARINIGALRETAAAG